MLIIAPSSSRVAFRSCNTTSLSSDQTAESWRPVYQNSIDTGSVPDDWLTANVVGIYKKGDKQEPANYRPVSLTSVTCKVLEHIIYSQIMSHYNKHNFLSEYQHGFRRGYSCETQLLATVEDIQRGIDSSSSRYDLVILDFTKAFDKVSFNRLIFKLTKSGINESLLLWITNWLTHRTQRVVVDGHQSREAAVTSGVPQGTVLGPLFFLVYINDIQRNISSKLRLFADDSLLYRQITKPEDEDILQSDINKLLEWAKLWQMNFNIAKCHTLRIRRSIRGSKDHTLPVRKYYMEGELLSDVEHHPYLCVELDSSLSWDLHLANTRSKSIRVLNMIRRNFTIGTNMNIRQALYFSLVRPHLEYASTVWDPHHKTKIDKLETVQNQAARFVTKRYDKMDSPSEMKRQLEWNSLQERRFVQRQSVIYKVHNQLTNYSLPIYCVPPARALKSHHKYSYQSMRALHDPYLYSFVPRSIRIWSILPVSIACAPSIETFKSRLIEAISTGAIVVAPPRTVTTIHAGVGARGQPLWAF